MAPPSSAAKSQLAALARSAVTRGHAALAAGQRDEALRWLDRAHRLVPADPNVMLSLASACLEHDPVRAAGLFRGVADRHDVRHAWLGLAAAQRRAGLDAAAALAMALSRHAFAPDIVPLAERIAGPAGWCGLASDGTVRTGPDARAVIVWLDGEPVPGLRLPSNWRRHRRLDVQIDGRTPLGSPIDLGRIRRVVGFVEAHQGGLRGWAWHPGDPDTPVTLSIDGIGSVSAVTESPDIPDNGPLARPRLFSVARDALPDPPGLIHVRGPDGRDVLGSPLDPSAEIAGQIQTALAIARRYPAGSAAPMWAEAPMPARPIGMDRRKRGVTVVIPVHNGAEATQACLSGVLQAATTDTRILVVDDGSTDAALIAALDNLSRARAIKLLRHAVPMGFPASANAGIQAASGRDVVLLNSDTLVPAGWLERLRLAAYSAPDIGSVTPLSNEASILSYPREAGRNPQPDQAETKRIDRLARRANADGVVDIPVGVGFCLYLRRDCLNATGLLRSDVFAQGYGEENDFCLRARHLGWRHVALPGLFVGHRGGASFDPSASHLRARNARILEQLHPGHDALIARFIAADPLADARRRLDLERFRLMSRDGRPATILITHAQGGGVEQRIGQAVRAHEAAGRRVLVLRPARLAAGAQGVAVHDGLSDAYPNLVYALPRERPALLRLLRSARPDGMEVHHLLDHAPAIYDLVASLNVSYDVHIHDYAWFCPRLSLVGRHDRYCGEPALRECEACVADLGHFLSEDISVVSLRARSAGFLAAARRVIAPSLDASRRMQRHFPDLTPSVVPHEDDASIPPAARPPPRRGRWRVCVIGGIGVHKGYDVLLACARDAAWRDLDLEFVVVGGTIDDARLLATERIFVTGRFAPEEAVTLLAAQGASLGFVPSIWPETWCLSLGDIWRAGLPAAAFDIGAPAERIRRSERGFVLPLGLSAGAINNALVVAAETAYYG